MSAPTRVRWLCPRGLHQGALAPSRLRADDVRRYCLPCSKQTGRLVLRSSPVLDRVRAKNKLVAQKKRRHVRSKAWHERMRAEFRRVVAGVQVLSWTQQKGMLAPSRFFVRLRGTRGTIFPTDHRLILCAGDWADSHDIQAQIIVWYATQYGPYAGAGELRRKEIVRATAEKFLDVRPRLDKLRGAALEIAMLLRKKEAATQLAS